MNKQVRCSNPNCRTNHVINPEKHRYRPKYCTKCRTVIDNFSHLNRVLSVFQRRKKERKQRTRENFVNRIAMILWSQLKRKPTHQEIEGMAKKGYVNEFEWEKD